MDDRFTIQQFTLMNEWFRSGMTREALLRLYQAIEDMNLRSTQSSSPSPSSPVMPHENVTACLEERGSTPESFNDTDNNVIALSTANINNPAGPSSGAISFEEEIERFKAMGEDKVMREIIRFIKQKNIKQRSIADMCNISQPYVSRFLNQDGPLSEKLKTTIYLWYLKVRENPNILSNGRSSSGCTSNEVKRDGFNFHPIQEHVLSEMFDRCQYPPSTTKEEIAERCNEELERLKGQPLRDSERATIRAVHNWFLTKRRTMTRTRSMQDKLRRNIDSSESPHNSNDSLHEGSVDLSNFELDTSENDFDSSQNFSQNFSVKVER